MADSGLATGLKNAILVALIILIAHMLLKNAQDPTLRLAPKPGHMVGSDTTSDIGGGLTASDDELLAYVYGRGQSSSGSSSNSSQALAFAASTEAAAPPPLALMPAAPQPPPQLPQASSVSATAQHHHQRIAKTPLPSLPGGSQTGGGSATRPHMIAAYANEDAMCGGDLFGTSIQAYEGLGLGVDYALPSSDAMRT